MNYIFFAIFSIEAIIKILGFGLRYFKDRWNLFDFIVIFGSGAGIVVSSVVNINGATSTTVIRSMRIARMFKLFRK